MRKQYLHLSVFLCDVCAGPVVAGSLAVRENEISRETDIRPVGTICLSCGHRLSTPTPSARVLHLLPMSGPYGHRQSTSFDRSFGRSPESCRPSLTNFVRLRKANRPFLLGLQPLYSGKVCQNHLNNESGSGGASRAKVLSLHSRSP